MPTGYTANVPDGITFEQFVWQCARGMGALVMMREEPTGAPIPERFEQSDYHAKRLQEATKELTRLRNLTYEQMEAECKAEHAKAEARKKERLAENEAQLAAYKAMLNQVMTWVPPTKDHENFKEFMADQLRKSIDFDDSRKYCQPEPMPTVDEWAAGQIANAKREIAYHTKEHQDEVERTEARNCWLAALRNSLLPND